MRRTRQWVGPVIVSILSAVSAALFAPDASAQGKDKKGDKTQMLAERRIKEAEKAIDDAREKAEKATQKKDLKGWEGGMEKLRTARAKVEELGSHQGPPRHGTSSQEMEGDAGRVACLF